MDKNPTIYIVDPDDVGSIQVANELIDELINTLDSEGIDIAELDLLGEVPEGTAKFSDEYNKALRKYVREFYEAQVVTETLNYYHKKSTDDKTYGAIYVYRNNEKLTYIKYEDMIGLRSRGS